MRVERIDHIHIAVRNLDQAIKFFSDALGTTFSDIIVDKTFALRSVLDPLGIELLESTSPEGVIAKFLEKRGEGLHAISLKVPDIEDAIAELKARGLRMVGRNDTGKLKEAQFHPKDAFGVLIELCEYQDEHRAYTALKKSS